MAKFFDRIAAAMRGESASLSMPAVRTPDAASTLIEPSATLYGPTAHRAAGRSESNTKDWHTVVQSADAELQGERETITGRTRDMVRSNGFASGLARTEVDSVLGARGLRLSARPDWQALGKSKAWADDFAAQAQSLYRSWAEDPLECDIAGLSDMTDQSTQHYLGTWCNGDSFALPLWRDRSEARYAHLKWSLCFQGIEADRVVNPGRAQDSRLQRGGIDIDEYGGYVAFNIAKAHPNDVGGLYGYGSGGSVKTDRIPAYTDWGRRRVIHIIERRRFGQTRAAGVLTPVLAQFKSIDGYMDAAMKNHILNTLVAMLITTPVDDIRDWFQDIPQDDGTTLSVYDQVANGKVPALKAGSTLRLKPGEEVTSFAPNRPDAQLDNFVNIFLREIAAATGSTYELLTKDFTKSNYSSIRAALVETWRYFSGKRFWLATNWHQRAYELLMEEAANDGRIDAPDFYQNRYAYCRAEWLGAKRGLIDPVRENTASVIQLENGLITYEDYFAEEGKDWREQFAQQQLEQEARITAGLPLLMVSKVATAAASAPAPDDTPPPGNPAPAPQSPAPAPNEPPRKAPPPAPKPPKPTPQG